MKRKTGAFFLWLFGWKIKGAIASPEECPKLMVVVGPHTSFMDFFVGLAVRMQQGRDIKYLAKSPLFKPPLGWILRWLGGYPVERSKNQGLVQAIVEMFDQREVFAICITPEGTRKRTEKLKSGFYHIAAEANVPIQLAGMDFGTKTVFFTKPKLPGNSLEAECEKIRKFWGSMRAYHPDMGFR